MSDNEIDCVVNISKPSRRGKDRDSLSRTAEFCGSGGLRFMQDPRAITRVPGEYRFITILVKMFIFMTVSGYLFFFSSLLAI